MKASKGTKSLSSPAAVKLQKDGYHLPPHDALAHILTNYQCPINGAKTEIQNVNHKGQEIPTQRAEVSQANKQNINHTRKVHHPHKTPPLHDCEDDPNLTEITNLQTKEVENYRSAMSKMAEDIITLRKQVVMLEAENSQLRSDLSLHRDLGQDLLDDTDIDVMTKAEIADRVASLKFKLASETSKAASQRDRIQQLQNELIRKNDSEKELLKLHKHQQDNLQHNHSYLAKMATLEATVKWQERVMEKMALDGKLIEKNRQSRDKSPESKKQRGKTDCRTVQMESALVCLREELDRIRRQPVPVIIQQSTQTKEVLPLKEKLSLLTKLEMAETRVQTLEAQMEESCKLWGRQKQEMLTTLNEHRHGFVYHNPS